MRRGDSRRCSLGICALTLRFWEMATTAIPPKYLELRYFERYAGNCTVHKAAAMESSKLLPKNLHVSLRPEGPESAA